MQRRVKLLICNSMVIFLLVCGFPCQLRNAPRSSLVTLTCEHSSIVNAGDTDMQLCRDCAVLIGLKTALPMNDCSTLPTCHMLIPQQDSDTQAACADVRSHNDSGMQATCADVGGTCDLQNQLECLYCDTPPAATVCDVCRICERACDQLTIDQRHYTCHMPHPQHDSGTRAASAGVNDDNDSGSQAASRGVVKCPILCSKR